jgi:hypothetical protein
MSRRPVHREGPSPLEWVESAVRLLRSAPPGALLCYYFGSATCLLGLLYFWADMSRGAFAAGHLIESAFNAAALYIWMKCWQAVFLSKMRAHLFMEPEAPWTFTRVARLVLIQATLQPVGLFLRLIAAQVLLPYVITYSVFMGVAILCDGTEPSIRVVLRRALRESVLWWRETHLALICLLGFAIFICLNVNIVCALLPYALRTFLGIETPFTRDGWTMFNTTFFAATFAATYLCFDPVRKAVFLVRHFHGQSLQSGEDLRVELRTLRQRSQMAMAALLVFAALLTGPMNSVRAEETPPPARIESSQLDTSLDRVLERREYAWRFPREEKEEAQQKGWLAGFLDSIAKWFAHWYHKIGLMMEKLGKWLRHLMEPKEENPSTASFSVDWNFILWAILIVLAVVLLVLAGMFLWRNRKPRRETMVAEAVMATPDLNEESVTADQLPEDGWLRMSRELMEAGQLRLALRAFYLATLAHLGQRQLIRLERYKSNHDYDRELQRRARGNDPLLEAFEENLLAFERAWYGDHDVTPTTLDGFSQNFERIRGC